MGHGRGWRAGRSRFSLRPIPSATVTVGLLSHAPRGVDHGRLSNTLLVASLLVAHASLHRDTSRCPYDQAVSTPSVSAATPTPLHTWSVPGPDGETFEIDAIPGSAVAVVGSNGAGKSALVTWMVADTPPGTVKRLIAHRRIWFSAAGPEITPAQRASQGTYAQDWDRSNDSRWLDHLEGNRASIILFDLLGRINDQNRAGMDLLEKGRRRRDVMASVGERVLPKLNRILETSGLVVQMRVTEQQMFAAVRTTLGVEYPISQMSDGEKAALLLAAEVLTAPEGQVILIDEPERHLHRSISAGLVDSIIRERPDCGFVVFTHDLDLAAALASRAPTHILAGCTWAGDSVAAWDLQTLEPGSALPETVRMAVLGGRHNVLLIEGGPASVDVSLYKLLFPEWTCSPAGGCAEVIRAVTGVRTSADYHWVNAVGIVDGDGRSESEREALRKKGVLALPVNEVECLYFLPSVIRAVARVQAAAYGGDLEELVGSAESAALTALQRPGELERFATKLATDEVTRRFVDHLPTTVGLDDVNVTFPSPYPAQLGTLQGLLATNNLGGLVRMVSIRDSRVPGLIASALRFRSGDHYELVAREQIAKSSKLRAKVLDEIGALPL